MKQSVRYVAGVCRRLEFRKVVIILAGLAGLAVVIKSDDPATEARVLVTAMTGLSLVFAIWYGIRSPWRVTAGGRALMYTTLALGVLGAFLTSSWWFGAYPGRDDIRSTLMLLLDLSLLYRLLLLPGYQRADRASREELTKSTFVPPSPERK